ncbi:2-octaprenyl-6-methoxyphenyl hydroxylase [Labrys okinawensis]|uniref:2-octaprenyl-6-methoxyphenyl hydroxylase n=1 Tax=Labrys okinawensis TaxID=346911 RepID=A0A2S9QCI0_9HYPH|nr:FAD-dependent monooxygenase [Labrys okinawensis]PRH87052.1 2-octaprenyl-6-methoxyphenyl hydroxylase [Labrys okinawensis]
MPANRESNHRPIVVVGAGLAGLACALILAAKGHRITLVGPPGNAGDTRTTALLDGSVQALAKAGIRIADHPEAAPLRVMSIVDATQRLLRARPIAFKAEEIGLEAFGWNIPNGALTQILQARLQDAGVEHLPVRVLAADQGPNGLVLKLDGQPDLTADLTIAADGRASLVRQAAGIETRSHDYPQVALALNLKVGRTHRDISTEFHTESGPFTLVPLPGQRASLVWVVSPQKAEELRVLDDAALARAIEIQSHALLGHVEVDGRRSFWPMSAVVAATQAAGRVALIGEAAHVLPPIGAQGFNLTLRDIAALARALEAAGDPGDASVLEAYAKARRLDIGTRHSAVDLLNRSLLSGHFPLQGLRGLGLYALERVGPLRRVMMRQGLARAAEH